MAVDRGIDGAAQRVGMALHQRVIALVDGPVAEGLLQHAVGALALGHDHDAGGARIEPVHDALPLGRAARCYSMARRQQTLQHRRASPARCRMRRDTYRLVYDNDVGVLIQHCHSRNRLRVREHGHWRWGQSDLKPLPGRHPIRLGGRMTANEDTAVPDKFSCLGPGEAEHPRQCRVEALSVEPVGHGDATRSRGGHLGSR